MTRVFFVLISACCLGGLACYQNIWTPESHFVPSQWSEYAETTTSQSGERLLGMNHSFDDLMFRWNRSNSVIYGFG